MNARKRLIRAAQAKTGKAVELYPLPEGKPELYNYRGEMRRYNANTGKYDLPA